MSVCRSCGAPMVWAVTEPAGSKPARKIPLDAMPTDLRRARPTPYTLRIEGRDPIVVERGNLAMSGETVGKLPVVRYVFPETGRYSTHFVTCPDAKSHRKART